MFKISQIIFQNPEGEFLVYLRDDDPSIPFPNHWDLIGGHVENGELPVEALLREIMEEIEYKPTNFRYWKKYVCLEGDVSENIKYIFRGIIDKPIEEIPLNEGQYLRFVTAEEIPNMNFANVMGKILSDFIKENK
jgi:8-oxo-dGTP pyrophosphatase MutT (NUDIX family)